jgi:MFS family permease
MNLGFPALGREAPTDVRRERSNVVRLAVAQALAGANSTVVYATGAIVGDMLAPTRTLASLPVSAFVVGMALCTLPLGGVAERHGRRTAFLLGAGCGILAGLIARLAMLRASFSLFCAAAFFGGIYSGSVGTSASSALRRWFWSVIIPRKKRESNRSMTSWSLAR